MEPDKVLQHLELVLESPSFISSKRCQEFLRYIVTEVVEGRGDLIKERSIAQDVFGKNSSFEPNEDALVRVKAREVRRRLINFYAANPGSPIQIDLPVGTYAPRIRLADEPPTEPFSIAPLETPSKPRISRRKFAAIIGGSAAAFGLGSLVPLLHHPETPLDKLWRPVFSPKNSLLIFIPLLHTESGHLLPTIGLGPAAALRLASQFLAKHDYRSVLRFGPELTYSQMTDHPTLLLGGFASVWAMKFTQNLRYTLRRDGPNDKWIVDQKTGKVWKPANQTNEGFADQDYGILCRLYDPASGQIVMIAAGILTFGTLGAAELLFKPNLFNKLIQQAPAGWESKNFQALIHVSVINTDSSIPNIIATHFW